MSKVAQRKIELSTDYYGQNDLVLHMRTPAQFWS